jgi:hypothetical protein
MAIVKGIAGQAKRDVGLDRRGQIGRPALEVRPRTVSPLLRADPACGLLELVRSQNPEELPQQQVLGIHCDVRAQLAFPPARGVLSPEHILLSTLQRVAHFVVVECLSQLRCHRDGFQLLMIALDNVSR